MKLTYAPQAGLRRRRPDHRRETAAFWAGIVIMVAFEAILMAKTWSPASQQTIMSFWRHDEVTEQADDLASPAN